MRTAEEVKLEFKLKGQAISDWAKEHGFSRFLVYRVLKGESTPFRGDSHKIAVKLGLKEGTIDQKSDSE